MLNCERLRTERLSEPMGLVDLAPEFTWALVSDRHGDRQSACEVHVDRVLPTGDVEPVWRSGMRMRRIGEEVRYAGRALTSRSDYRWQVRAWDADGQAGPWSKWVTFETGVMAPDRIAAGWIGGGGALRRAFQVTGTVLRARAYVSGLGYYAFFCNGRKVSAAALAPSFTEFDRRVEYETIDLTADLRPGDNGVGFLLADGWWRHGVEARQQRENQAIAEIVLEYADGRREVVGTDQTWMANVGPFPPEGDTSPHQLFDGLTLDLGWLASAWCVPGAEGAGWQAAHPAGDGIGALVPSLLPLVREVERLRPLQLRRVSDTLLSVDCGQNFTGWVRFRARAPRGTVLVVRHAELLREDGRLNPDTLRTARQTDTFLLAGTSGGEIVEPGFLYHGFRYAEIEGPVDAVDVESIEGVVVHTGLERVGEVSTSDVRINWLLDAVRWTVRSNAMSVMTDVCQRDERRGWLMDGSTALKSGLLFYDLDSFARKWVEDMIDNQEPDGSLRGDAAPVWFPCKSVGWQRGIVVVPLAIYEVCGDTALLRRALGPMRRYADYLLANLQDDLLPGGFSKHPTEWLCVARRNAELGDNALAIDVLRKVAHAASVLGESGYERYSVAADRVAAAAHRRWHADTSGCFGGSGGEDFAQANQVYALRFGLTVPESRQRVFDSLVDDLMNARGDGPWVTTGIGSTEHLPFVLSEFGRDDLVWQWLQRDAYPGYGFMQRHGATAIWECWEQRTDFGMNAHNHTGLTGIGVWLMQKLVGIGVEPGPEPVFHLQPAIQLPLASLSARWQSRWGEVSVGWMTQAGRKLLTVSIPPGCAGTLKVGGQLQSLSSGTHRFEY